MSAEKAGSAPTPGKKKGGAAALVGIVVTALLSGGAAFAGVKVASGPARAEPKAVHVEPPGPTVTMEPFIATVLDGERRPHALKLTLAIELKHDGKEEEFKAFIPRARDAVLTHVRGLALEDVASTAGIEDLRKALLDRVHAVGAQSADHILVTDLITQ